MTLCALCDEQRIRPIVLDDAYSLSMICLAPLNEGHVLVLPKRHVVSFHELREDETYSLLDMMERVSKLVSLAYARSPLIIRNMGVHSSQPHIHFHVLPSKGNLRALISTYEDVPAQPTVSAEETYAMRNKLRAYIR